MKVLFFPEVEEYLFELTEILYRKEYFGFKKSAVRYVTELVQDIVSSLDQKSQKEAPFFFKRYGKNMYYANFRKNKNTEWYVFFTIYENKEEKIYLV